MTYLQLLIHTSQDFVREFHRYLLMYLRIQYEIHIRKGFEVQRFVQGGDLRPYGLVLSFFNYVLFKTPLEGDYFAVAVAGFLAFEGVAVLATSSTSSFRLPVSCLVV